MHFWIIGIAVWVHILINYKFVVPGQKTAAAAEKKKYFAMPSGHLMQLGVIGFCSMATECAMFDWIMMAMGRFLGDKMIQKFGRKRWLQISGVVVSSGMFVSVVFPFLIPSTLGFMMIGVGVSGIVPMVYTIAGNSKPTRLEWPLRWFQE